MEGLVGLDEHVPVHRHVHRLRQAARREAHAARGGDVVAGAALALPSEVFQAAVTSAPLGFESVTVNFAVELPALPSTMRTSSIDIRGTVSSSRIVP